MKFILKEFADKWYLVIFVVDMSKFSENIDKKEDKKVKDRTSREELGKYFFDLSKLSFGAMVLGVVVPWFTSADNQGYWAVLLIGLFATMCLAFIGYKIIKG